MSIPVMEKRSTRAFAIRCKLNTATDPNERARLVARYDRLKRTMRHHFGRVCPELSSQQIDNLVNTFS